MVRPRATGAPALVVAALLMICVGGAGCAGSSSPSSPTTASGARPAPTGPVPSTATAGPTTAIELPPPAGRFSYQLGGDFAPPADTAIVDRDHSAAPAAGLYSICYINAFQAQTADVAWWQREHPALLLHDADGSLVVDDQWNEPLFDLSTAAKRSALAAVVGGWIDGCARAGYRAVEPDNLDSYTRSHGRLTAGDALAFAAVLATRAHHDGLAIAQKNAADLSVAAHRAGLDFAIAEECQVYQECSAYTAVYGDHLIEVEYTDNPLSAFTTACRLRGSTVSVVLRDRDVTPAGQPGYVERWC